MPPRTTISENMLWSLMAVLAAHFMAAWLFLGPPEAAKRWEGMSPKPAAAWELATGEALGLDFVLPPAGQGGEVLRLVVTCKGATSCQGLKLRAGGALIAGQTEGDQTRFSVDPVAARRGLELVNSGHDPIRVAEYHLRNYAAENPNFPRLGVLWPGWEPPRAQAVAWVAVVALGGILLTLSAWLFQRVWVFWLLAAGPILLVMAAGFAVAADCLRPVLAWDAFLLTSGLGPALWLLGRLASWAWRQLRSLPGRMRTWFRPRSGIFLALLLIITLLPPVVIGGPPARMPFNPAPRQYLQDYQPDYVIIGNSMAYTRINYRKLEELMPGRRVTLIRMPGSVMENWYLMLKNYVLASEVKPKRIFLFFRDDYLTRLPTEHSERQMRMLESQSPGDDPELNRVLYGTPHPYRKQLGEGLMGVFSLGNWGVFWRRHLRQWVTDATIPPGFEQQHPDRTDKHWIRKVNSRFNLDRLRPDIQEVAQEAEQNQYDFAKQNPKSFLPLFIGLTKKAGIPLMMIRVQRNPKKDGFAPQKPELKRYIADLSAYLARQGVDFHDFNGDPEITPEFYSGADHIWDHYRDRYTEIFYHRLAKYLP